MASEFKQYHFKCDEFPPNESNGTPGPIWLGWEPSDKDLTVLKNGLMNFQFRLGTSFDEVAKIADFLNEHVEGISYTDLRDE